MFIAAGIMLRKHSDYVQEQWKAWCHRNSLWPSSFDSRAVSLRIFRAGWFAAQPHGLQE